MQNTKKVYTNKFKAELDQQYDDFTKGKSKIIKASESKKRIKKILKATGK